MNPHNKSICLKMKKQCYLSEIAFKKFTSMKWKSISKLKNFVTDYINLYDTKWMAYKKIKGRKTTLKNLLSKLDKLYIMGT